MDFEKTIKSEVSCFMVVFLHDIPNVKQFFESVSKYDVHHKGVFWRAVQHGVSLEVNFITTIDLVEQIKEEYKDLAFKLTF